MAAIKINGEIYDQVPSLSLGASKWLTEIWEKLGKPQTPFSKPGEKLINVIIAVWEELYPKDAKDWYKLREDYQRSEKTIPEQVNQKTGRSLASFPYPIFALIKKLFPKFKIAERKTCIKIVARWPMFRMCNRV